MMGSASQSGTADLMTPEQQDFLMQAIQGMGPQAQQAIQGLLQGFDPAQNQEMFQQAFIDPAMMAYEQDVLPGIQQRFVDANAGSSSALNQALGRSAADLSTMLGSQMGQFTQQQQAMSQQGQLGGLQALLGLTGQRAIDPIIQQRQGLAGPLIEAGGRIAASSSVHVKENIRDFKEGLEAVKLLDVKQYDYKAPYAGKDRVGLIAENVPKSVQADVDGVLGVDLYGLLSLAINAIKDLTVKVEALEAK